ncbi:4-hydroxy-tetrahydrodipicolinate synthase [Thermoplasmatales archaeon]|nr:4-hydroxy-tetrahydrodipicolinate synthase [Thermoplasmatales archaeon]
MNDFIVPIVTPFKSDNTIDKAKLRKHADYLFKNGVDQLLLAGSTGLGPSISTNEKISLLEEFKDLPDKVILQVGGLDIEESKLLAMAAKKYNIAAIAALPPYYYPRVPEEWYSRYFREISEIYPTLAYNFPLTTGYNIFPPLIKKVNREGGNIIGIKETLPDLAHMLNFKWEFSPSFKVYCGPDTLIYPSIKAGLDGVVAGSGNYAPSLVNAIISDLDNKGVESQKTLSTLTSVVQKYGQWAANYSMIRILLKYDAGMPRSPMYALSTEQENALEKEVTALLNAKQ